MRFVDRCHQAGHRRDHRLGAGALSARRRTGSPSSTAPRSTSTRTRASASTRTGARRSSTTAGTRSATSSSRTRCTGSTTTTSTALRVDAVASMLYLDYSRKAGRVAAEPATAAARTSTRSTSCASSTRRSAGSYPGARDVRRGVDRVPGVTQPAHLGGLGFHFKWNMGWMNDTLRYAALDPIHRRHHHQLITFSFVYAWSERLRAADLARRGRARQGLAARQDARRRVAEARQLPAGSART